jgi:hypothetical protein
VPQHERHVQIVDGKPGLAAMFRLRPSSSGNEALDDSAEAHVPCDNEDLKIA